MRLNPRSAARKIGKRLGLWKPQPQYAQIGPYRVRLPNNSLVLQYQRDCRLYDTALGHIAEILKAKYPSLSAIDIGANVGDTCALIRKSSEIPVLCVEADPILLPILEENVSQMGAGIAIERSFVGPEGKSVSLNLVDDLGHDASLVRAVTPGANTLGSLKLRSLSSILADHPSFRESKLFKLDTEGFDFDIIRQSIEYVRRAKPVTFFEYNPYFRPDDPRGGLDTLEQLADAGYSEFIYYDNFGNFLLHLDANNRGALADLDGYLASNRKYGVRIYYFDVCALHREDAELVLEIRSRTRNLSAP